MAYQGGYRDDDRNGSLEGRYGAEPYNYGGHYSDYGGVPYSVYYGPAEWGGTGPRGGDSARINVGRRDNSDGGSYGAAPNHAGRGPRNYQRSDERIQDDVNEALTRHSAVDASDIEVQVDNGEVTLSGTVHNRAEKRMAEDAAESASGVRDVHNQIRIDRT